MKNVQDFHEKKKELENLYSGLKNIQISIKKEMAVEVIEDSVLNRISNQMNDDKFIIAVVGVIKRGKSTLLNALLETEHEILPTDVTPETARLSYLQFGKEKTATVHFIDGSSIDIPLDELPKYTSAVGLGKKGDEKLTKKTNYAEIYYPNKYLENDVVIVDTPGVDDPDPSRSEVTEKFIAKADAAIFLIDATEGGLKEFELRFMRTRLLNNGNQKGIMVVINKIGALRQRQLVELPKLTSDTKILLEKEFHIDIPVFEVDAKNAWDGKKTNDDALIEKSKIIPFLIEMEKMLIENKGKILIKKRASELKYEIGKPLRDHLEYELHASNNTLDSLKIEIEKLDANLKEQGQYFNKTQKEYERKLSNLNTDVESDIRRRISSIHVEGNSDISKVIGSALIDLEESVQNKIKKLLTTYKNELGAGNINIPSLELEVEYPEIDVDNFYSTREIKTSGDPNAKGMMAGFMLGNLVVPFFGGLIGAGIAAFISSEANSSTHIVKDFDQQGFQKALEKIKKQIIHSYSDQLEGHLESFNEKIDSWLRQQKKTLSNKKNALENKKESAEKEYKNHIERIEELRAEMSKSERSIERILDTVKG